MDRLAQLVQGLPPAVYNKIYEEVFTFDKAAVSAETKTYKPPACLQVDRASRHRFVQCYYGTTVFRVTEETITPLLESISEEHRDLLQEVRYVSHTSTYVQQILMLFARDVDPTFIQSREEMAFMQAKHMLRALGGYLPEDMKVGRGRFVAEMHYVNKAGQQEIAEMRGS